MMRIQGNNYRNTTITVKEHFHSRMALRVRGEQPLLHPHAAGIDMPVDRVGGAELEEVDSAEGY
jgi:hypothetical protein